MRYKSSLVPRCGLFAIIRQPLSSSLLINNNSNKQKLKSFYQIIKKDLSKLFKTVNKKGYYLWLMAVISTSTNLYAQDTLRLPDAINKALQKSLDIRIAKNNIEVAGILNSYGVAGGLPIVTANIADNESVTSVNQKLSTGLNIQRNNAAANALNANVTGSILLFNGGRVIATKQRLATLQTQSNQLLNSQVQNVIGRVSIAYYDVVRQQNYIKTINKASAVLKINLLLEIGCFRCNCL